MAFVRFRFHKHSPRESRRVANQCLNPPLQRALTMKLLNRLLIAVAAAFALLSSAPPVQAAATSSYFQNHIIDQVFRAQTALSPATIYTGLFTGTINAQSCGGEVSGGSYARQPVTSALANWAGTQGAGTTSASSNATGSSGTTSNNNAITYPAPTGNWTTITGFCLHDAVSGGNELIYAPLTTPKTV
jgi:hypothetical protein